MSMDTGLLDKILHETIDVIERSKEQIFEIAESARSECRRMEKEVKEIKEQTLRIIEEVDHWEIEERKARRRLMRVSKDFQRYSQEDIRQSYEEAHNLQMKVAVLREKERQMQAKRTELEISYANMVKTAEKAEKLVTQVGVAMSYLSSNLQNIWEEIEKLQQQQQIGFAIIKAQEEERRRIARGIHDGPAQSMANVVLRAEYCEQLLDKKPELLREELRALKDFTRSNLEDIRKIIFDLRPMDLDDLGLVPAIKRYATDFAGKYQIHVEVNLLGEPRRYTPAMEVALFRIMQEALNNVWKHSRAGEVKIIVETTPLAITMAIKDDGIGFNVDQKQPSQCFGLRGMREWAAILRGTLRIASAAGKGTSITVKIPVEEVQP
ncbi:MAG TPA: histidine kinase [Clostridia bacterium]|nr:histidine kinase [Clostridia bacterium]